jgi:hypothetical protein
LRLAPKVLDERLLELEGRVVGAYADLLGRFLPP